MKRYNIAYIVVDVLIVAALLYVVLRWEHRENRATIEGVVEARTYRSSSKVAGRIDSLFVAEGDVVERGELLYTLSTPELRAKLGQVEALRAAAEALAAEVDDGARRQQRDAAYSMWQRALAAEGLAAKSFERVARLYDKGVVPRQQYDEAEAALAASRAATSAARDEYELVRDGATRQQRDAVAAKVREAQAAVSEVNSYVSDARVYAPASGRVVDVVSYVGELVGVGYPVVTIIDTADCWVSFNIREDDFEGVAYGAQLRGYIPALRRTAEFEIYYIAAEADFATWSATRARGGFDIRSFEVRARAVERGLGLLPGMSVIVDR